MSDLDTKQEEALLSNEPTYQQLEAKSASFPHAALPKTQEALSLLGAGQLYSPPYSLRAISGEYKKEDEE